MNNRDAFRAGRRQALIALGFTLAEQLDTTDKQIHAQISAQYRATLLELEELADPDEAEGASNAESVPDEAWTP